MPYTIATKLKQAIEQDNLVLFIGAGTSLNLLNTQKEKIGNWNDLVRRILIHLNGKNENQVAHLLPLVGKYNPIDILHLLEKANDIDKRDIYDFLKDHFDLGENDLGLHKKLTRISRVIITTNYDTAFETCSPELKKNVAYKNKNYELVTHKDNSKPLLFKLHGCFLDAGSMVLFPSNYEELYNNARDRNAEHTLLTLRNLVINKTILFIGCGMGDFQINHIFREIRNIQREFSQPHFIISTTRPDNELNFLTHIAINDHQEITAIVDDLIAIKQAVENSKNEELKEKEKQIDTLSQQLKETESKHAQLIGELFNEALDFNVHKEYAKAIKKYRQICLLEKRYAVIYNNWGNALLKLAKTIPEEEQKAVLQESCERYQMAFILDKDNADIQNNWGIALTTLAKISTGEDKKNFFMESCAKYKEATGINKEHVKAYNNWGSALSGLAKMSEGTEQKSYFMESRDMYKQATMLNNDYAIAYDNLGNTLLCLAHISPETDRPALYEDAEKALLRGIALGNDTYNLACLYAVWNKKKEAMECLEKCLEGKQVTVAFVQQDSDWARLKEDPDFIALLDKYS